MEPLDAQQYMKLRFVSFMFVRHGAHQLASGGVARRLLSRRRRVVCSPSPGPSPGLRVVDSSDSPPAPAARPAAAPRRRRLRLVRPAAVPAAGESILIFFNSSTTAL
jgi:hypothetical protein